MTACPDLALAAITAELGPVTPSLCRFFDNRTPAEAQARLRTLINLAQSLLEPLPSEAVGRAQRQLHLAADALTDHNADAARRHILEAIRRAEIASWRS